MPGVKTNERPGTKAVLRHGSLSAFKAREVLDLIRGKDADRAAEILANSQREAARVVGKVLASAVANAVANDGLEAEELYVAACFADEGATLKRWRPRARGRATRIRKRTCHITVIVARMDEDRLRQRERRNTTVATAQRSKRVAASRRARREARQSAASEGQSSDRESQMASSDSPAEADQIPVAHVVETGQQPVAEQSSESEPQGDPAEPVAEQSSESEPQGDPAEPVAEQSGPAEHLAPADDDGSDG